MATVLITGGTGMIGKAITKALLEKGYKVIILTRKKTADNSATDNLSYAEWDIDDQRIDQAAIKQSDYIIHLAGANVGEKRWTKKRKKEIIDSRVKSAGLLIKALRENNHTLKGFISASGIDWYPPDPVVPNPHPFTESAPPDDSFLADVCVQWEKAVAPVQAAGTRLVILRTAVVLSKTGGAMKEFKKPLRFGVAAIFGSGRQMTSWIHIDDLVRLYITAIEDETISGIYNASAPDPVPNKTFVIELARAKRKFFIPFPIPAFILKTILGEMSAVVLKGCTVGTQKILAKGFSFQYPDIESAVRES